MNNQVIFLLQAISGVIGFLMAYTVLKYLNHKALGMQTINDQMIKDKIYISVLSWIDLLITEVIGEYKSQLLNHSESLLITLFTTVQGATKMGTMHVNLILHFHCLDDFV